jgi:membrane protease YdiL (CAAX protease family)
MLAAFAAALIAMLLQLDPTSRPLNRSSTFDEPSLIIAAVILAPIGEEIFFRGFALTGVAP